MRLSKSKMRSVQAKLDLIYLTFKRCCGGELCKYPTDCANCWVCKGRVACVELMNQFGGDEAWRMEIRALRKVADALPKADRQRWRDMNRKGLSE